MIIGFLCVLSLVQIMTAQILDIKLVSIRDDSRNDKPLLENTAFSPFGDSYGEYSFAGKWIRMPFASDVFSLSVDECLVFVRLDRHTFGGGKDCSTEGLKNYTLDVDSLKATDRGWLGVRESSIEFVIYNGKGYYGGIFDRGMMPVKFVLKVLLCGFLFLLFGMVWGRPFQKSAKLKPGEEQNIFYYSYLFLALSLVWSSYYFNISNLTFGQYDLIGHQSYLTFAHQMKGLELPKIHQWYESHQMPLYYWLFGNKFFRQWTGMDLLQSALLGGSVVILLAQVFYVLVAAQYTRELTRSSQFVAILWFLFIPAQWMLISRVNNDVMGPILGIFGLCLSSLVFEASKQRILFFGILVSAAVLTKLSFVSVALGIGGGLFFEEIVKSEAFKKNNLTSGILRSFLFLLPSMLLIVLFYLRVFEQTGGFDFLGPISEKIILDNHWTRFVLIDPVRYFSAPFYSLFVGPGSRDYFWEALGITLISGANPLESVPMLIQVLWRAFVLAGFFITFAQFVSVFRLSATYRERVVTFTVLFGFALLIYHRIKQPAACNQDGRFLAAILPAWAFTIGYGIQNILVGFSAFRVQTKKWLPR